MVKITLIIFLLIYGFIYLILGAKTKKPFKTIFLNAFLGILLLLAISFTKRYTGINLPVNGYTLGLSGIFGIPGAVFLLIANLIIV